VIERGVVVPAVVVAVRYGVRRHAQSLDFQRGGIGPNGRSQYRVASDHRLAQRYEVAQIFSTLAERFETTRLALNDIADRYFFLGDPSLG
jgi:hypothetical protein